MTRHTQELTQQYFDCISKVPPIGGRPQVGQKLINAYNRVYEDRGRQNTIDLVQMSETKTIWVWSDQHFGHKNIIRYAGRPYPDPDLMDECLIKNFNQTVGPDDICIWCGDVGFGSDSKIKSILRKLNGYNILVVGNHDFDRGMKLRNLPFDEVHPLLDVELGGVHFVFTHYPFYGMPVDGNFHNVYGHVHEKELPDLPDGTCVCIEQRHVNYRPIPLINIYDQIVS